MDTWLPDHNLVIVILNETGWGGCGGRGFQIVTLAAGWDGLVHEFGHGAGGLADETDFRIHVAIYLITDTIVLIVLSAKAFALAPVVYLITCATR